MKTWTIGENVYADDLNANFLEKHSSNFDSVQAGASIAIASVASQTVFTRTVAANTLRAGSSIKLKLAITWASANYSTQNWKVEVKFGGTIIATLQLSTGGTSANDFWIGGTTFDINIACTTTSAQTTFIQQLYYNYYQNNAGTNNWNGAAYSSPISVGSSSGSAAVDVTASKDITVEFTRITNGNGGTVNVGSTLVELVA